MQFSVIAAAAILPLAARAIDEEQGAIFAGGPQSPPASTSASLTEVPTVGTIITEGGSTYVAPIETYPAGSAPVETMPSAVGTAPVETMPSFAPTGTGPVETIPSVATTPLIYPINSTYTGGVPPTGNLSTTLGSATTTGGSASSGSTVLVTTTGEGGEPVTQTSVVAVEPTDSEGGDSGSSPSAGASDGSTQPGAGNKMQAGAAAALAVFAGIGAFFL